MCYCRFLFYFKAEQRGGGKSLSNLAAGKLLILPPTPSSLPVCQDNQSQPKVRTLFAASKSQLLQKGFCRFYQAAFFHRQNVSMEKCPPGLNFSHESPPLFFRLSTQVTSLISLLLASRSQQTKLRRSKTGLETAEAQPRWSCIGFTVNCSELLWGFQFIKQIPFVWCQS